MAEESTQVRQRGIPFNLPELSELNFSVPDGYSFKQWKLGKDVYSENSAITGNSGSSGGNEGEEQNKPWVNQSETTIPDEVTYVNGESVTFTEDTHLYAEWEPIPYAITYSMNYPESVSELSNIPTVDAQTMYTIEDMYQPPFPAVTFSNYVFNGWTPEEIQKGSMGPQNFSASWAAIEATSKTITYVMNNKAATLPSGLFTSYSPQSLAAQGYTPANCVKSQTQVKTTTDYSSDTTNYPVTQYRNCGFLGWSPSKLHYGRTDDMKFYGNWKVFHVATLSTGSSKNIGNKTILVKLVDGNWILSFGDDQTFSIGHDGDKDSHWATIYLEVYAKQGKKGKHICSIPIPKSCVFSGQDNYTDDQARKKFQTTQITTPVIVVTDNNSQEVRSLKTETITYNVQGKNSSIEFKLKDIPVKIPVPGSKIVKTTLDLLDSDSNTYKVPKGDINTSSTIDYQIYFSCQYSCKNFSVYLFREPSTKKAYATLTRKEYGPMQSRVYYKDGTFGDTSGDTEILAESHLTSLCTGKNIERIVVGNNTKKLWGDIRNAWKETTEEIILTKSLTTIESQSFEGCKIKSLVIPSNVTEIGVHAFRNCTNLTFLAIESDLSAYAGNYGSGMLEGCTGLRTLHLTNCSVASYQAWNNNNLNWWWGTTFDTTNADADTVNKINNLKNNLRIICSDGTVKWDGSTTTA